MPCYLMLSSDISLSHQEFITRFVTRVTRHALLEKQELFTLPEHMSSPLEFIGVHVVQSLAFCVVFCRSLFVLLSFLFWPLYCLSFNLWLLNISLVFSNFSYYIEQSRGKMLNDFSRMRLPRAKKNANTFFQISQHKGKCETIMQIPLLWSNWSKLFEIRKYMKNVTAINQSKSRILYKMLITKIYYLKKHIKYKGEKSSSPLWVWKNSSNLVFSYSMDCCWR